MGPTTTAPYRASFNDGQIVSWDGEKITEVAHHPAVC